eukprot:7386370-Prymnesium_polylepis.3
MLKAVAEAAARRAAERADATRAAEELEARTAIEAEQPVAEEQQVEVYDDSESIPLSAARWALEAALSDLDVAERMYDTSAAQARVEEQAVQLADALEAFSGEDDLPREGAFRDPALLLAALQPKPQGGLAPVRLLRSSWIKARARLITEALSDEQRRALALPRRQDLEGENPDAFFGVDGTRCTRWFNVPHIGR